MNKHALTQIIKDSDSICDKNFGGNMYSIFTRLDDVERVNPIWQHIVNNPELDKELDAHTQIGINKGEISYTCGIVDIDKLLEYLDINMVELKYLFYVEYKTRNWFIETMTAFIDKEIEIRECCGEDCGCTYETVHEDKASLCDECKDYWLNMCGM